MQSKKQQNTNIFKIQERCSQFVGHASKVVGQIDRAIRGRYNVNMKHYCSKRDPQIKRALVFTKKISTLVTKGRALLQIEKKDRASLGQGRALRPVKTGQREHCGNVHIEIEAQALVSGKKKYTQIFIFTRNKCLWIEV